MPSTYSDILGLELQETGENLNAWGERLNRALRMIDDAQAFEVIPLTGNLTLTNTMNMPNQARKGALAFTDAGLTAVPVVTVPPVKRLRYIENRGTTYAITITAGAATASVPPGRKVLVLCDGANVSAFDPVTEVAQLAAAAQTAASNAGSAASSAAGFAGAAAASATASASQATRLQGTSITSHTPSVGSKTFTTQEGKAFDIGSFVHIQSRGTLNRWMAGRVTDYSGGSLTVAVDAIGSTTTAGTDWDIRVSGARGPQGVPGIATLGYAARSSNTALVTVDSAHWYDLTGTFTQTFAAASAIGVDWYVVLRNAGTGDITLDPNGSETIDGLTSFIMYPGEVRLIQCDGAAFRSVVIEAGTKVFTSAGNFVWPPGINGAIVDCDAPGGGGGGGGPANGASGAAGGGGGRESRTLSPQVPGTTTLATPGASGAGGVGSRTSNVGATQGQDGGNSTFGDLVKAFGGKGGIAGSTVGGSGGAAGFLDLVSSNSPVAGSFGAAGSSVSSDRGGSSGGRSGISGGTPATSGGDAASGSSGGGGGGNSNSSPAGRGGKSGPLEGGLAGAAGASGASANGGAGGNGADGAVGFGGTGGGGGGHAHPSASPQNTTNGNGGKGGNGGFPGGGGGGGGSCVNQASNGGDGGNGGAGRIVVRMF